MTHSFLVMPECPYPLIGRDLLHKLQAQISFDENSIKVSFGEGEKNPLPPAILYTCPLTEEHLLLASEGPEEAPSDLLIRWTSEIPRVWAENNPPGLAIHQPPVVVALLPGVSPIRVRQYPLSLQARLGISVHIQRLKKEGILVPCKSAWNTPLLPVQKPGTTDYRPVQDLREVN